MLIAKLIFVAVLALFVSGCEEKLPVYAAFEKGEGVALECLAYGAMDNAERQRIEAALRIPRKPQCSYKLQLIHYRVGKCDNPVVKSTGSDFDGYVRIEVRKGFDLLYKVQSDFKNDPEAAFERVLERAKKDIGYKEGAIE